MKRLFIISIFIGVLSSLTITAQTESRPLIHPMEGQPGLDTWLLGQPYGNTTGAFNFGTAWYSAGQGLHFGLDYPAACGTPLVAVADGFVAFADNFSFGSRPHNLILRHPDIGLTTLYGHLLDTPLVREGEPVVQGQLVGYSGDPDETCDSRPHLHFELRSLDYRTALNPVNYIDANWHNLMLIGSYGQTIFQQDQYNARRWMSIDDQPDVAFGGARLNDYQLSFPPPRNQNLPNNARLAPEIAPLSDAVNVNVRRVGFDACCLDYYWHPTLSETFYTVDGGANQLASIFEWSSVDATLAGAVSNGPRPFWSPDGSLDIRVVGGVTQITRLADGESWAINAAEGVLPAVSPDSTRLLWTRESQTTLPGQDEAEVRLFTSDIRGENVQEYRVDPGTNARWLDNERILLTISDRPNTRLAVLNITDTSVFLLGSYYRLRGLTVAPGGGRVMFYLASQSDPSANGVYMIETQSGAQPVRIDWFGAWRWRDADSVYYIPFEPNATTHQLRHYDFTTGIERQLTDPQTQPFTVMNGKWAVSPDGDQILFHNLIDRNLWLININAD